MKILQISPYADPKRGGQERHVLALCKILASLGHEVTLLTCKADSSNSSRKFQIYTVSSLSLIGLPFVRPKELMAFLSEKKFDICHLHYKTLFGEIVLLVNRKCKLPTVTTLHSQMIRRLPAKFFYDRISLKIIGNLSKKVICLSPKLTQELIKRGLKGSKCVVIPNAVDVKMLKDRLQKIRRGLHESEFDLLFVGRLEQRKGIKWLLQSLALLHKKRKRMTLKIVGQGPLKGELQRFILAKNLKRYVDLLGYVSDRELLKLFLLAKCIVIPSFYEGIPTIALEAIVANKPLIVSNIPGLNELVVNGGNGLVVDPMDVYGLASAIESILLNTTYLNSLNHVNQKVLRKFDWSAIVPKILETYHEVLVGN